MYVSIVAWDLEESSTTVEDLRFYLRDYAVDAYSKLEGMRLKAWFSNSARQVWGAVYLWDAPEFMNAVPATSRATEIIGYPPTSAGLFELEAVTEGVSVHEALSGIGLAFGDLSVAMPPDRATDSGGFGDHGRSMRPSGQ